MSKNQLIENIKVKHLNPQVKADNYYFQQQANQDLSSIEASISILLIIAITGIVFKQKFSRRSTRQINQIHKA